MDSAPASEPASKPSPPSLIYRVNAQDEFIYVNDQWQDFAQENASSPSVAGITPPQLLGHSLWEFVTDDTIRQLYRTIMKRVRAAEVIQFSFRCDSPACRRFLQMDVTGGPDGSVEFRTTPIREEARPAQLLLDATTPRSAEMVVMCSWCNRIRVDTLWLEVEDAVDVSHLFEEALLPALSHGICHECYQNMRRRLAA